MARFVYIEAFCILPKSRLPLVGVHIALVLIAMGANAAEPIPQAGEIAKVLAAKDGQFDNVRVTFIQRGVEVIKAERIRQMTTVQEAQTGVKGNERPLRVKPVRLEYLFNCELMVRDTDVTYSKKSESRPAQGPRVTPFVKWSNVNSVTKDYTESFGGDAKAIRFAPAPAAIDAGRLFLREIELTLGFGLGSLLPGAVVSRAEGTKELTVRGQIMFTANAQYPIEFTLDDEYVARRIRIDAPLDRGFTQRYEIHNSGMFSKQGFVCAKQGSFRQLLINPGTTPESERTTVQQDFEIEVLGLEFDVPDKQYLAFVDLPVTSDMQVMDPHGLAPRSSPETARSVLYFTIPLTILVVIVLAVVVVTRRKQLR